jgi:hypothetical protein
VDDRLEVGSAQVLLANFGVDIGQFDFVRAASNKPITRAESGIFYQLLAAANNIAESGEYPGGDVTFQDLLKDPSRHYGAAVRIDGFVRRVVRIAVNEGDVRSKLGTDGYYELDMFVPIGENRIIVNKPTAAGIESSSPNSSEKVDADATAETVSRADADHIIYEHRFPATVCVVDLPAPPEQLEGKRVVVDGFFMKLWNYESRFTEKVQLPSGQTAPLVIGLRPRLVRVGLGGIDWMLAIFAGVLVAIAIAIGWLIRSEFGKSARGGKSASLPDEIDFSRFE